MRVGVVAPSSPVGKVELELGLEQLRGDGFEIVRHEQCAAQHFTFAGTDEDRAAALLELAVDPSIDVIWAARGGYGAARLLPMLEQLTTTSGIPPRKLLVGYSDITVLHEFLRKRWGWSTLHAPMPAADLSVINSDEWRATVELVKGTRPSLSYEQPCLKFITSLPAKSLAAELIGGNLSLWASLMGTAYQPSARGKFLFLEDLSEPFYRIDRMFTQVVQSGCMDGALGLILGDFTDCKDESHEVLKPPTSDEERAKVRTDRANAPKIPLRPVYQQPDAFEEIFGSVGRRMGFPVAVGLPVGHGRNFAPLPLGADYELSPDGALRLIAWDWIDRITGFQPVRTA